MLSIQLTNVMTEESTESFVFCNNTHKYFDAYLLRNPFIIKKNHHDQMGAGSAVSFLLVQKKIANPVLLSSFCPQENTCSINHYYPINLSEVQAMGQTPWKNNACSSFKTEDPQIISQRSEGKNRWRVLEI